MCGAGIHRCAVVGAGGGFLRQRWIVKLSIHAIVKKLVGQIDPVGETREDEERFGNLQTMTELVDKLLSDIDQVGMLRDRHEASVSKAGKFASDFFGKIGIL